MTKKEENLINRSEMFQNKSFVTIFSHIIICNIFASNCCDTQFIIVQKRSQVITWKILNRNFHSNFLTMLVEYLQGDRFNLLLIILVNL